MNVHSTRDELRLLKGHDLFGKLGTAELESILSFARVETYAAKETIFLKGSPGRGMMAVLEGRVQMQAPSADGRTAVLNVMEAGEIFGEIALLDGRDRSADAVAMTACRLLVIDRREFIPFLRQNADVALRLMAILCERLRRTTEQVEDLLFLNLHTRLAKKLLSLAAELGEPAPDGRRTTPALSQRELAAMVGFTRESVNKQLSQWQRDGVIEARNGRIALLDEARLRGFAEGTP